MPTARPRIWLDVDGVINSVMDPADVADGYTALSVGRHGYSDTIIYRPIVAERLRAVAGQVDVVFHTAWYQDAATYLGPALGLHLTASPCTPDGTGGYLERWWKTAPVLTHGGPALWIDDDLAGHDDELAAFGVPGLEWIAPDTFDGLSDAELDRIDEWVVRVTRR